jgi:arylsulfatase A-like enzyme
MVIMKWLHKKISIGGLIFLMLIVNSCNKTDDQKNESNKPNIILIMGDDIGFSDIGSYGSEINTPNLDRLAKNGIRFNQFYNMAKCNPTRSTLLTGLYQGGDNAVAVSLGNVMRSAGYKTIMSGKEHFDNWVPVHCRVDRSFDEAFYYNTINEFFIPPNREFMNPFILNGKPLKVSEIKYDRNTFYKTDVVTDYALTWMNEAIDEDKPFFLYLPYHAAHYPLQAREEDIAKYRGKYKRGWDILRQERFERMKKIGIIPKGARLSPPEDNIHKFRGHPNGDEEIRERIPLYRPWNKLSEKEKDDLDLEMAVFAAMVDRMDYNIGRIIKNLEENDQMNNTIILFLSDNGSCPYDSNRNFDHPPGGPASFRSLSAPWANLGNTPFRFYKQYGHEGGSRTHFIVHWPKNIQKGVITSSPFLK